MQCSGALQFRNTHIIESLLLAYRQAHSLIQSKVKRKCLTFIRFPTKAFSLTVCFHKPLKYTSLNIWTCVCFWVLSVQPCLRRCETSAAGKQPVLHRHWRGLHSERLPGRQVTNGCWCQNVCHHTHIIHVVHWGVQIYWGIQIILLFTRVSTTYMDSYA